METPDPDHVTCLCCGRQLRSVNNRHLQSCAQITVQEYRARYPDAEVVCETVRKSYGLPGERNPNFRGWATIKHCTDCGKRLAASNKSGFCVHCTKVGERNPFYGKKHDEETRDRMSKAHETRDPSTYYSFPPVDPAIISARQKRRWAARSPEEKETIIQRLIESGRNAKRKQDDTKIEQIVKGWLVEWSVPFEPSVQIGRFRIDIVAEGKHGIECYGDFWHANPRHYASDWINLETKLTARQKWDKDERRRLKLNSEGYHILVLWEEEIHKYPDHAKQKLRLYLGLEANEDPDDWDALAARY